MIVLTIVALEIERPIWSTKFDGFTFQKISATQRHSGARDWG